MSATEAGDGELKLRFDATVDAPTKEHFIGFVANHVLKRALPESVAIERMAFCANCGTPAADFQVRARLDRGLTWIRCGVCDARIVLAADTSEIVASTAVETMNTTASDRASEEAQASVLEGKVATGLWDVFIAYSRQDGAEAKKLVRRLTQEGIRPWFDQVDLVPGRAWQSELERDFTSIGATAILVGAHGLGPWEAQEQQSAVRMFVKRGAPVIPVILKSAPATVSLPMFLENFTKVDFRKRSPDPLQELIRAIRTK